MSREVRIWTVTLTPEQIRNAMFRVVDKPRRSCFADDCHGRLTVSRVEARIDESSGCENYIATTMCNRCSRVVVQPSTYSAYISTRRAENSGPIRTGRY